MDNFRPYRSRNQRLRDMGVDTYKEYLQSDEWKEIRNAVLARDKNECLACGGRATCVHHTNYSGRSFREMGEAHVSLCHSCHKFIEFDREGK